MPRSLVPPETLLLLVLLSFPLALPPFALHLAASPPLSRLVFPPGPMVLRGCLDEDDSWLPNPAQQHTRSTFPSVETSTHHPFYQRESQGDSLQFQQTPSPFRRSTKFFKTFIKHETNPCLEASHHPPTSWPPLSISISREPALRPRQSACLARRRCLGPGGPSPSRRTISTPAREDEVR